MEGGRASTECTLELSAMAYLLIFILFLYFEFCINRQYKNIWSSLKNIDKYQLVSSQPIRDKDTDQPESAKSFPQNRVSPVKYSCPKNVEKKESASISRDSAETVL